MRMIDHL